MRSSIRSRSVVRDERVLAINWGPWRDVGMAARMSSSHPLLGRRLIDTDDEIVYSIPLSHEKHWVLAEHRTNTGKAVLPRHGLSGDRAGSSDARLVR